jgi:HK97 family phage portal protein
MILDRAWRNLRHIDPTFGSQAAKIPPPGAAGGTFAGVYVDEHQALRMTTVWACVSLIADAISILPAGVFRQDGQARVRMPDPPWLAEPVPGIQWHEWVHRTIVSLLLRGNAYCLIVERDGLGYPASFEQLHPDEVTELVDRRGRVRYRVAGVGELDPVDVLHIRGLTLPGRFEVRGLSPIGYARQTIGTALAAEEFGARFFGEGAHPSGVLTTDGPMDKETAQRFQKEWMELHGQRHRKPAVLSGGLKWQPISLSPEESQFLATIDAKAADIAGFFRVPPHLIGDVDRSTSWGSGIEEQGLQFVVFTLGAWIVRVERALSALLPKPRYLRLNVSAFLRGRTLERYQAYLMGRQGGWLSIDDVRALEEMPPLPDGRGTDYLQPLNYAPIPPGGGVTQVQGSQGG